MALSPAPASHSPKEPRCGARSAGRFIRTSRKLIREVSARHGLPPLVARILLNRGLTGPKTSWPFWTPPWSASAPLRPAPTWKRPRPGLGQAVRQGETVAVYGDYDADGLTATCLLHQFFQELGLTCPPIFPTASRKATA